MVDRYEFVKDYMNDSIYNEEIIANALAEALCEEEDYEWSEGIAVAEDFVARNYDDIYKEVKEEIEEATESIVETAKDYRTAVLGE